jgi:hypothetical protein
LKRLKSWIAVSAAVLVVGGILAVSAVNWRDIGGAGISVNGWIALVLGVVATFGLGVGLMALVFISNRRGYDEPPAKDR